MNKVGKRPGPEQPNVPTEYPDPSAADRPPRPDSKDRPGFDLGGSDGKETAGSGLGLGQDAFEDPARRGLPRRPGASPADQGATEKQEAPPRRDAGDTLGRKDR
ncbi:hypothetical protein [Microvirga massiliensis]|uniref:hypothetical protein n=1 Tax=Microvirga massiliensis TaxID=1033741 RepID=UPI0006601AEA|nr:hypothetical protein [Microvirga massiliensis]